MYGVAALRIRAVVDAALSGKSDGLSIRWAKVIGAIGPQDAAAAFG
jgi:hypothetical protein